MFAKIIIFTNITEHITTYVCLKLLFSQWKVPEVWKIHNETSSSCLKVEYNDHHA